ncbi:MAG: nicotinate (nicotinamide) nucleotide adenylyltransferase [Clostridia bacterium]|nr:nicotinate (nicotinamide) nucleotide adenylyltransferase [Clostridia bacterium]
MRIGIFGGSFDPVHVEHVHLAERAVEDLQLDTLFVMPASCPPHKKGKKLASDADRLAACRAAFSHLAKVEVSGYEIHKRGTSYTFETCRYFKEKYDPCELFFLVGTDMLRDFPNWKNPEDILLDATLAVCARAEESGWEEKEHADFYARFGIDFITLTYQGKNLSSTKVRVLAAAGEELTPYVGGEVAKLLNERGTYRMNGVKEALALEKPQRKDHSLRVAFLAAKLAPRFGVEERKAIKAALLHDCAKNLTADSPLLKGLQVEEDVPPAVWHQFAGAYLAEHAFEERDEDILNAIRYHTSGRAGMSPLEKLVFLSDLLEEERTYAGVERLRELLKKDAEECLLASLKETVEYLERSGKTVYRLTKEAYEYYKENEKNGNHEQ